MNNKKIWFWILIAIVITIAVGGFNSLNQKNKKLRRRLDDSEDENEYLRSIIEVKEELSASSPEIAGKLTVLIGQYETIYPEVASELSATIDLLEIDRPEKAAFALTKIIENLLRKRYEQDQAFRTTLKPSQKPTFHDYLKFAQEQEHLSKEEYHFVCGLKEIRNQEAHELGVQKVKEILQGAFFISIGLLTKFALFFTQKFNSPDSNA